MTDDYLQWSGGLTPEEVKAIVTPLLVDTYKRRDMYASLIDQCTDLMRDGGGRSISTASGL